MTCINRAILTLTLVLVGIAAFAQAGTNDPTFNPDDLGNGFGDGADDMVKVVCVQPDGKILIGGKFTKYNGVARSYLARLNADGTLDASFHSPIYQTPVERAVNAIIVRPDGKIMIGGIFSIYDGSSYRVNIARLNANGSLDPSFTGSWAAGTVYSMVQQSNGKLIIGGSWGSALLHYGIARLESDGTLDPDFNANGSGVSPNSGVKALAILPDDRILIGGTFTSFNGQPRSRVARLDAQGNLDSGFVASANEDVRTIAVGPDGTTVLGGAFTVMNGLPAAHLARVDSTGALDPTFTSSGTSSIVYCVKVQSDHSILLTGAFSYVNGIPRNRIAKLTEDGALDPTFAIGSGAAAQIFSAGVQADGKVVIGGDWGFVYYNNDHCSSICRLNQNGGYDLTFNPGSGATDAPSSITVQPDDKIILGGGFTRVNGVARYNLARMNADGSLDLGFDPGIIVGGGVGCTARQPDGKVLLGGAFTTVGGVARNAIARVDPDGGLDTAFDAGSIQGMSQTFVSAIAIQADGMILLGGIFDTINGVSRNSLARLYPDGSLDLGFMPSFGAYTGIECIQVQPDGKVLISGAFSTVNGLARNRTARLNTNGSVDLSFDPGIGPQPNGPGISPMYSMSIQQDGKIVITGAFDTDSGVPRDRIVRLYPDGTVDMDFDPGASLDYAHYVLVLANGSIAVSGLVPGSGQYPGYLALLDANGAIVAGFDDGSGPNRPITCIGQQSDGKILIGGAFTRYDQTGRNRIARVLNDISTNVVGELFLSPCIFPNPSSGIVHVSSVPIGPATVTVTDLTGKLVLRDRILQNSMRSSMIDLSGHPPGTYLITMSGSTGTTTERLVIQ